MDGTTLGLDAGIALLLMLGVQMIKTFWPDKILQYKKYLGVALVFVAGIANVVGWLALHTPILVANPYLLAQILAEQLLVGLGVGLSAVGLYTTGNNLGAIPSTSELVVMRAASNAQLDATIPEMKVALVEETDAKTVTTNSGDIEVTATKKTRAKRVAKTN
jgi:hypothetical protein